MTPANHSSGCTADVPTENQQSRGRCEYVAARRALKAALTQDGLKQAESLVIPKALDRLDQSFDLLIVEPLLKEATGAVNSMSRALLIAAADVIERLHESSPLVHAGKDRGLGRRDVRQQGVSEKELAARMKWIDQLIVIRCAGPSTLGSLSDIGSVPTQWWIRTMANQGESNNRADDYRDTRADL